MSGDRPPAVEEIDVKSLSRRGGLLVALGRAQQRDAAEKDAVARDIAGESDRRSKMQDHPAGERRPEENPQLRIGGGDADRRGKAAALDKARQEAELRGDAEGVNGAVQEGQRRQKSDRQLPGEGEAGQRGGLQGRQRVGDEEDANPVMAIGEDAAERHQRDIGRRLQQRDDRQPARRMGEIPCRPRHRHGLNEIAEPGHDGAEGIAAEIAVLERVRDAAQP